jgi:Immunity protein 8
MIYPEIRHIHSPDLDPPNLPADATNCEIRFNALIGPKDGDGQETFTFTVVTAGRVASAPEAQWGRGKLLLATFAWSSVVQAVAKLLAQAARPTWGETVAELNKELLWESDQ